MRLRAWLLPTVLATTLHATDHRLSAWGGLPGDGVDDTQALISALAALQDGDRLFCEAGIYDLFLTQSPQALTISNRRRIAIHGNGATFLLHRFDIATVPTVQYPGGGLFVFNQCAAVTVDDLTVDMARAPFSNGTVVQSYTSGGYRYVDVRFEPEFPVHTGMRVEAFHRHTPGGLPWGKGCDLYLSTQPTITMPVANDPQRLRIRLSGSPTIGVNEKASVRHRVYGYNALTFLNTTGITVAGVVVHTVPGMGIFTAGCSDITVSGLQVIKKPGSARLWSTTADATHFVATSGLLSLTNNLFESMGDDGCNVHGVYSTVVGPAPAPNVVRLGPPTGITSQFMAYAAGDSIEFCNASTLVPVATATVVSSGPVAGTPWHDVVLNGAAPSLPSSALATNLTRIPTVSILGTTSRHHRGRGILIQARNVTVDGCTLAGCTGPGINVTCDGKTFYESIGTRAVTIRNCVLESTNNGQIGGNGAHLAAIYVFADTVLGLGAAGLHDGIAIQDNMIRNTNYSAIHIGSTTATSITGNTFDNVCKSTSGFPAASQSRAIWFANAVGATVTGNTKVNGGGTGVGQVTSTGINVFGNTGF
ncbi:MAG: right-handed parallel beta-helix repeat-containing protein [Planctomycetes bacterium]|nr:right-handed parallel beta-helix repeat-containing protein [Planctomycetota bacterium]